MVDGFEIVRQLPADGADIEVTLHLDVSPPRVKVSTQLSQLIKQTTETRPRILMLIWGYAKVLRQRMCAVDVTIRPSALLCSVRFDSVRFDSVRFGSVRFGGC